VRILGGYVMLAGTHRTRWGKKAMRERRVRFSARVTGHVGMGNAAQRDVRGMGTR